MKTFNLKNAFLVMYDDGKIHYPFSKFLTDEFTNPNTRELISQSLRIFYRFCTAHSIELALRATQGMCLTYDECNKLAGLCFRPISEIESMSDRKVFLINSAITSKKPQSLPEAVNPNTVLKRLNHISQFLIFFREVFIEPNIRSRTLSEKLHLEYEKTLHQLATKISGTKQVHHHDIKSLPSSKFLQIIKFIYQQPELLFLSATGKTSRTINRDRAMCLLACEGLRPGTLGNIRVPDFRPDSKHLVIKDNREKRTRTSSSTPVLKLGASTKVNSASETMIELWPFTIEAIQKYIETERKSILLKTQKNVSLGFLFINEKGEPIKHRSSITSIFNRLGKRLLKMGLLDIGNDPYFSNKKYYDFYGYVLRHSSASLFLEMKGTDERVMNSMKIRYGWTVGSNQPQRYAARALSDKANIDLMEFYQELILDTKAKNSDKGK